MKNSALIAFLALSSAAFAADPVKIDKSQAGHGVVVIISSERPKDLSPLTLKAYAAFMKSNPRVKAAEAAAIKLASEDIGEEESSLKLLPPKLVTLVDWKGGRPSNGEISSNATYLVVREIHATATGTGLYEGVAGAVLTQVTVDESYKFDQESDDPGVDMITVTLAGPATIKVAGNEDEN